MIKSIEINDFQCHEHKVIDFHPHVNMIVGTSDKGKSSIIRALTWVALNTPKGDSFIRHKADKASVEIKTNNNIVKRVKGKGENTYYLNDEKWESFGNNIPEPVTNALDLTELNFQLQHDTPFMLSQTSGEVGRQLNKLVNLEIIDRTLKNLNTYSRGVNRDITNVKNNIADLTTKANSLPDLDKIDNCLSELETMEQTINNLNTVINDVKVSVQQYELKNSEVEQLDFIVDAQNELIYLQSCEIQMIELNDRCAMLSSLIYDAKECSNILKVDVDSLINALNGIRDLYNRINEINIANKDISTFLTTITNYEKEMKVWELEENTVMEQKKMIKICPTCKREL